MKFEAISNKQKESKETPNLICDETKMLHFASSSHLNHKITLTPYACSHTPFTNVVELKSIYMVNMNVVGH